MILDAGGGEVLVGNATFLYVSSRAAYTAGVNAEQADELERLGVIEVVGSENNWGFHHYYFRLTSAAEPYIVKQDNESVEVAIATRASDIRITGMTGPTEAHGQKWIEVEYQYGIEPTPFGKVLALGLHSIEPRTAVLELYDDGWRVTEISQTW